MSRLFLFGKVLLALSTLSLTMNASAAIITDFHGSSSNVYLSSGSGAYEFSHDINDEFNRSTDIINSISLDLDVVDDNDRDYNSYSYSWSCSRWRCYPRRYLVSYAQYEYLNVNIDGANLATYEVDYNPISFNTIDFAQLQETGTMNVSLTTTSGDLYFRNSTLTVDYVTAVSEPGSLALFGLGLAGLCAVRKKSSE